MNYLIILTILFSPLYVWRFNFFGLPLNFFLIWNFFVFIYFFFLLLRQQKLKEFLLFSFSLKINNLFIYLFLFFAVVSLLYPSTDIKKLGQFLVLFLQPIILFFCFRYFFYKNQSKKNIFVYFLYFVLGLFGALAIIQYFSLFTLPEIWQGNSVEPKRAISFFSHPNFYALYCAPLLAFLVPDLAQSFKLNNYKGKTFLWLSGAAGLLFSLSRAGWLGLGISLIVYLLFFASKEIKKLSFVIIIVMVIVVFLTPNLRYRVILPFYGEKSAVSRFSLWDTGVKAIKQSPVFGLGLNGFSNNWQKLNTDPNLDTHNFPHNIFLNFWVETGLFGLISFLSICFLVFFQDFKKQKDIFKLAAALFILTILTQGQIDNPYFKNDLAIIFWTILSLSL